MRSAYTPPTVLTVTLDELTESLGPAQALSSGVLSPLRGKLKTDKATGRHGHGD